MCRGGGAPAEEEDEEEELLLLELELELLLLMLMLELGWAALRQSRSFRRWSTAGISCCRTCCCPPPFSPWRELPRAASKTSGELSRRLFSTPTPAGTAAGAAAVAGAAANAPAPRVRAETPKRGNAWRGEVESIL